MSQIDIRQVVDKASTPQELEVIGKTISVIQAKELFEYLKEEDKEQKWKLQPLLVGMTHDAFSQLLLESDASIKQILMQLSQTEPMQHHLSLFCHELTKFSEEADRQIMLVEREIQALNQEELHKENLRAIERTIEHFTNDYGKELIKIENVLSIAWYGECGELIDLLSTFKEQYQRVLRDIIGMPRTEERKATGLYEILESKLSQVFNNGNELEALRDDEPAMAALAKLSLWYVKDYWEACLLPKYKNADKLELPELRMELDVKLRSEVEANLNKLGLNTVGDFKQHGIFSQKMLKDFIKGKLESV